MTFPVQRSLAIAIVAAAVWLVGAALSPVEAADFDTSGLPKPPTGRPDLAASEYARAVVALPEDHRSYSGLAALHEAVGVEATDGNVQLHLQCMEQRLSDRLHQPVQVILE